ncbi:nuclear factor erythroid 2-related factor 2a isoform X2 [Alosa alosa]|uniref:nuclear factor erythroid 2-related factor 2a isoform X2 n=1 Tax=Alosa alosa TaxID=278164 RepID=UPI0020151DE2|nr:nuclear factor erythroid 2-related factor 2a isoform X2 [Alosa alosa]
MMEIELPKLNSSQQDMDMIDILWKQDIDLGAGREVFDVSYRQKEHELQKQRALEEEKRQQMLLEQEKALLAQLQLDEETGEFVPRAVPSRQPQPATDTPSENVGFTVDGEAMSFDECMELLAQTFPLVEASETASPCLGTSTPPTANSQLLMAPEQPPLVQTPLLPPTQKTWPDLDQAWMELLSIPELECLNMQMQEPSNYLSTNPVPEAQDPSYGLFMPGLPDAVVTQPKCPPEFMGNFEVSFPGAATGPANLLSQMSLKAPDTAVSASPDEFCDIYYPDLLSTSKATETPEPCSTVGGVCQVIETPSSSPLEPLDVREFSAGDPIMSKSEMIMEFPDSDSGLSLDASPNISSPEKSMFGDGSLGFSDSDMDDSDSGPGSESDYSEMFSLPFSTTSPSGTTTTTNTPMSQRKNRNPKHAKTHLAEASVHGKPPFTKDKAKRRSESRLSRDEQRAKALQIPFTVDMIINLPVDDFNEMMSKHQLNEPQLALVRDIRRRGKNKVAAQNCRKRKMQNIVGLECDLDSLKEERERLLHEKTENSSSLRQMKQQLNTLYLEVFSLLQDEQGRPYSPADYSLQQTSDGNVFLVPRVKKTLIKSDG